MRLFRNGISGLPTMSEYREFSSTTRKTWLNVAGDVFVGVPPAGAPPPAGDPLAGAPPPVDDPGVVDEPPQEVHEAIRTTAAMARTQTGSTSRGRRKRENTTRWITWRLPGLCCCSQRFG